MDSVSRVYILIDLLLDGKYTFGQIEQLTFSDFASVSSGARPGRQGLEPRRQTLVSSQW